jgi:DNA primase
MIPESIVSNVLSSSDLVHIVSEYSPEPLKKSGSNFTCRCFFHNERTPSFVVSQVKQLWHCKGCGAGGNAIGFIERIEGVGFPEAVRMLAARAGIEVSGEVQPAQNAYARQLAEEAAWWYRSNGIRVDEHDKGALMKQYYKLRSEQPHLTVRQFREEQAVVKECERIENAAAGMVGDMFEEDFEELLAIVGRHFE